MSDNFINSIYQKWYSKSSNFDANDASNIIERTFNFMTRAGNLIVGDIVPKLLDGKSNQLSIALTFGDDLIGYLKNGGTIQNDPDIASTIKHATKDNTYLIKVPAEIEKDYILISEDGGTTWKETYINHLGDFTIDQKDYIFSLFQSGLVSLNGNILPIRSAEGKERYVATFQVGDKDHKNVALSFEGILASMGVGTKKNHGLDNLSPIADLIRIENNYWAKIRPSEDKRREYIQKHLDDLDKQKDKRRADFYKKHLFRNSKVEENAHLEVEFDNNLDSDLFKIGDVWLKIPPTHITISQARNSFLNPILGSESKPIASPVNRVIIKVNVIFTQDTITDFVRIQKQFRYCPINMIRSHDVFNRIAGDFSFLTKDYGQHEYIPVTMDEYTIYTIEGHPGAIACTLQFSLFNYRVYLESKTAGADVRRLEYQKHNKEISDAINDIVAFSEKHKTREAKQEAEKRFQELLATTQVKDVISDTDLTYALEQAIHPYNNDIEEFLANFVGDSENPKEEQLFDLDNSGIIIAKIIKDFNMQYIREVLPEDFKLETRPFGLDEIIAKLNLLVSGAIIEQAHSISATYQNNFARQPLIGQSQPGAQYIGPGDTTFSVSIKTEDPSNMQALFKSYHETFGNQAYGFFDDRYMVKSTLFNLMDANIVSIQNLVTSSVESKPGLFDVNIIFTKNQFEYNFKLDPPSEYDEYWGLQRLINPLEDSPTAKKEIEETIKNQKGLNNGLKRRGDLAPETWDNLKLYIKKLQEAIENIILPTAEYFKLDPIHKTYTLGPTTQQPKNSIFYQMSPPTKGKDGIYIFTDIRLREVDGDIKVIGWKLSPTDVNSDIAKSFNFSSATIVTVNGDESYSNEIQFVTQQNKTNTKVCFYVKTVGGVSPPNVTQESLNGTIKIDLDIAKVVAETRNNVTGKDLIKQGWFDIRDAEYYKQDLSNAGNLNRNDWKKKALNQVALLAMATTARKTGSNIDAIREYSKTKTGIENAKSSGLAATFYESFMNEAQKIYVGSYPNAAFGQEEKDALSQEFINQTKESKINYSEIGLGDDGLNEKDKGYLTSGDLEIMIGGRVDLMITDQSQYLINTYGGLNDSITGTRFVESALFTRIRDIVENIIKFNGNENLGAAKTEVKKINSVTLPSKPSVLGDWIDHNKTYPRSIKKTIAFHKKEDYTSGATFETGTEANKIEESIVLKNNQILQELLDKNSIIRPFAGHRYFPAADSFIGYDPLMSETIGGWFFTDRMGDLSHKLERIRKASEDVCPWNKNKILYDENTANFVYLKQVMGGMMKDVQLEDPFSPMQILMQPSMNREIPDQEDNRSWDDNLVEKTRVQIKKIIYPRTYKEKNGKDSTDYVINDLYSDVLLSEEGIGYDYMNVRETLAYSKYNNELSKRATPALEKLRKQYQLDSSLNEVNGYPSPTIDSGIISKGNWDGIITGTIVQQDCKDSSPTNQQGKLVTEKTSDISLSVLYPGLLGTFDSNMAGNQKLNFNIGMRFGDINSGAAHHPKDGSNPNSTMPKDDEIVPISVNEIDKSVFGVDASKINVYEANLESQKRAQKLSDRFTESLLPTFGVENAFPTYKLYVIKSNTSDWKWHSFDDYWDFRLVQDVVCVRDRYNPVHLLKARVILDPRYVSTGADYKFASGLEYKRGVETGIGQSIPAERRNRDANKQFYLGKSPVRIGMRVCLKLGYHTDPRYLDTVFIGTITELNGSVDSGYYELTAEGDGRELLVPAVQNNKYMAEDNYHEIVESLLLANPNVIHFGKGYGSYLRRLSYQHKYALQLGFGSIPALGIGGLSGITGVSAFGMRMMSKTKWIAPTLATGSVLLGLYSGYLFSSGRDMFPAALEETILRLWKTSDLYQQRLRNKTEEEISALNSANLVKSGSWVTDFLLNSRFTRFDWKNMRPKLLGHVFDAGKCQYQLFKHFYRVFRAGAVPVADNIYAQNIYATSQCTLNISNKVSIWEVLHQIKNIYPNYCLDIRPYGSRSTIFLGPQKFPYWRTDDPVLALLPQLGTMEDIQNFSRDAFMDAQKENLARFADKTNMYGDISLTQVNNVQNRAPFINFQKTHVITSENDIILNGLKPTPERGWNTVVYSYAKTNKGAQDNADKDKIETLFANVNIFPDSIIKKYLQIDFTDDQFTAQCAALGYLKEGVERLYGGTIIIRGNPKIEPHDRVYISDSVNQMFGWVQVETVIHKFDQELGYTTHFVPNLICDINNNAYMTNQMVIQNMLFEQGLFGKVVSSLAIGGLVAYAAPALLGGLLAGPVGFVLAAGAIALTIKGMRDSVNEWIETQQLSPEVSAALQGEDEIKKAKILLNLSSKSENTSLDAILTPLIEEDYRKIGMMWGFGLGYLFWNIRNYGKPPLATFFKDGKFDLGNLGKDLISRNRWVRFAQHFGLGDGEYFLKNTFKGESILRKALRVFMDELGNTIKTSKEGLAGTNENVSRIAGTQHLGSNIRSAIGSIESLVQAAKLTPEETTRISTEIKEKLRKVRSAETVDAAKLILEEVKADIEQKISAPELASQRATAQAALNTIAEELKPNQLGTTLEASKKIVNNIKSGGAPIYRVLSRTVGKVAVPLWLLSEVMSFLPQAGIAFAVNAATKNNCIVVSPVWWRDSFLMPKLDGYMNSDILIHFQNMLRSGKLYYQDAQVAVKEYTELIMPNTSNAKDTKTETATKSITPLMEQVINREGQNITLECILKNHENRKAKKLAEFSGKITKNTQLNTPYDYIYLVALMERESGFNARAVNEMPDKKDIPKGKENDKDLGAGLFQIYTSAHVDKMIKVAKTTPISGSNSYIIQTLYDALTTKRMSVKDILRLYPNEVKTLRDYTVIGEKSIETSTVIFEMIRSQNAVSASKFISKKGAKGQSSDIDDLIRAQIEYIIYNHGSVDDTCVTSIDKQTGIVSVRPGIGRIKDKGDLAEHVNLFRQCWNKARVAYNTCAKINLGRVEQIQGASSGTLDAPTTAAFPSTANSPVSSPQNTENTVRSGLASAEKTIKEETIFKSNIAKASITTPDATFKKTYLQKVLDSSGVLRNIDNEAAAYLATETDPEKIINFISTKYPLAIEKYTKETEFNNTTDIGKILIKKNGITAEERYGIIVSDGDKSAVNYANHGMAQAVPTVNKGNISYWLWSGKFVDKNSEIKIIDLSKLMRK